MKFTAAAIITLAAGAPSFDKPKITGCDEPDVCKSLKAPVTTAQFKECIEALPAKCQATVRFTPGWEALDIHDSCKNSNWCGYDLTAWRKVITDNIPKGSEISYVGLATVTSSTATYKNTETFEGALGFEDNCEYDENLERLEMAVVKNEDNSKVIGGSISLQKILEGDNSQFVMGAEDTGVKCADDSKMQAADAQPVSITYTAPSTSGVAAKLALGTAALTAVLFA